MPVVFELFSCLFFPLVKKISLETFLSSSWCILFLADKLSKLMKRGILFFFLSKHRPGPMLSHEWLLSKYANEHFSKNCSTHGDRGNIQWSPLMFIIIKYLWISAWKILVYPKSSSFLIFLKTCTSRIFCIVCRLSEALNCICENFLLVKKGAESQNYRTDSPSWVPSLIDCCYFLSFI